MKKISRLAVLGSGKGSNFAAILDALEPGAKSGSGKIPAEVVLVASDRGDAGILDLARGAGIPVEVIRESQYRTRLSEDTERNLVAVFRKHSVDWIILAGFLRVLKSPLLEAFPKRIINIHPSLLPKFPGLNAWTQALEAGETITGCTVHYVDAGVDTGELIAQREVPIHAGDTPESLHARIQVAEHQLYVEVLAELLQQNS